SMTEQHDTDPPTSNPTRSAVNDDIIQRLIARVAELEVRPVPYAFAVPEKPVQKYVFTRLHQELYPSGISTAAGFYDRTDRSPEVLPETLPKNPYQSYMTTTAFGKFPEHTSEKKIETALASIQSHISHLTRPIDQMAFEAIDNYFDWGYKDDNGNVNPDLQDYSSVEELANDIHEIYTEQ
ncbi:hypothetical protein BGW39_002456, partial [Mortierella sp. 14UC]